MSKTTLKKIFIFLTLCVVVITCAFSVLAKDENNNSIEKHEVIGAIPDEIPLYGKPVALLVGIHSSELAYNEISALTGFELFTVPYSSDIKTLVEQLNPTQIIIKHPSGFVGLYLPEGALIRGVKTLRGAEVAVYPNSIPPSIIQPDEAAIPYPALIHSGSLTGTVPHGGLGFTPPPKGRGVLRHLLKLGSVTGLTVFQYPGYFNAYSVYDQEKLFPALLLPNIPVAIGALNSVIDGRLDESEYEYARTQPRDYKFQPVIEGY